MSASLIQKLTLGLAITVAALSVLLLLPITDNFVLITKNFVLFFGAILFLALFVWRTYIVRTAEFVVSPFTVPLFLFGLSVLASIFFTSAYPHENILGFGGVYVSMVIIGLLGGSLFSRDHAKTLVGSLAVISGVLSLTSILQMTGFGPANILNALFGLSIPTNLIFNLTGSSFIAFQVGLVTLLLLISSIVITKKLPKLYALLIPIIVVGLLIHGWSMLPGKPAALVLPQATTSWSVALDAIRSPRAALIGTGPALYANVYNQFKPVSVNTSDTWNVQFGQASNLPLTLLATNGFLGLISWLVIFLLIIKQYKSSSNEGKPIIVALITCFVIHLLIPVNVVLLTIEALLLASFVATEKHRFPHVSMSALSIKVTKKQRAEEPATTEKSRVPALIGLVFGSLIVLSLTYLTGRAYAAHIYMNEAAKASAKDDGVAVYENQQKAAELNPYLDYIRREYAVTNMLIAAALSNKTDASEAEKQQVTQLIQQAIREARSATLLDASDTQNWVVLAQIYQNMIGVTEEAEQWAIQSYVQAIQTSPTDPTLRINLGGIFLNKQQYTQAGELFAQATQLKADYPNAYYNLAIALQNLQQYEDAKTAYQKVLTLLEPSSENYTAVTAELEKVEKLIEENKQASGSAQQNNQDQTSIINQNIEDEDTVINEPSTGDLDLSETPEASATPEPTTTP